LGLTTTLDPRHLDLTTTPSPSVRANPSIMGLATKPDPSAMGLEQHQTQAILV